MVGPWQSIDLQVIRKSAVAEGRELWTLKAVNREIPLLVAIPAAGRAERTLVGLNFHGLHTVAAEPDWPLPAGYVPGDGPGVVDGRPTEAGRGRRAESWSIGIATDAGIGVATAYAGDFEPDSAALARPGTLSRWASGLSAIRTVLQQDGRFGRVFSVGHSRMGKSALIAAAFDEGFEGTIPIQSGCGGAAPSRTKVGETVADITRNFPYWFAPAFGGYAQNVDALPFDQHWLLALVAPRPILLMNAEDDTWANPFGQHAMLAAVGTAFQEQVPDAILGTTVGERFAHFYRPGGHSVTREDWVAMVDWVGKR